MPKKAPVTPPAKGAKKEAIVEWWEKADKSYTSKDAQPLIAAYMATKGLEFKQGDLQTLITVGREKGKFIGLRNTKYDVKGQHGQGGFSGFVTTIVESGIDAKILGAAIEIIGSRCTDLDQARQWAGRWEQVLQLMGGDTTKAQQAVQLFTGE